MLKASIWYINSIIGASASVAGLFTLPGFSLSAGMVILENAH